MPPETFTQSDSDLESVISVQELASKRARRNSFEPKYHCSIEGCQQSFKRLDHLDRHEHHHTGIKKHACSYEGCGKTYSIVTHLKRHLRTTHERTVPATKNVPCEIESCDKMFTSACNMQRHIREVHENPKVYYCSHCSEKFTQKLKMRRHEIAKHTGEYPYSCDKCSKGFCQQWQHEKHVAVCKVYICPTCAQQFDKWSLYLAHCRSTQHGKATFKCNECEHMFLKASELKRHMARVHYKNEEGENMEQNLNYKCSHEGCSRSYAYERNLRQHIQTAHSGKRFSCLVEGCLRQFSSAQNLDKHAQRDHSAKHNSKSPVKSVKKSKKQRRKRKDAGKSIMSNLSKLSGLAVDRPLDKLLRQREAEALENVSKALLDEEELHDSSCVSDNGEAKQVLPTVTVREVVETRRNSQEHDMDFESLVAKALAED